MEDKPQELDIFGPEIVIGMIVAVVADALTALFLIVVVGFFIHWAFGIPIYFLIIPRLHNFLPKALMWTAILVPLPFFSLAIVLAAIGEKSAIARAFEEQAVIVGVGAATGGLGALAGEGAEAAAAGAEVAEAGAAAGGAATAGGEAAKKAGERGAARFIEEGERREQEKQQEKEAGDEEALARARELGETPPFFPEYKEELFGTPANESGPGHDVIMKDDGTVDLSKQ